MTGSAPVPRKVLLIGAGVIGTHLLNALIESKASFDKIGIFTRRETATSKAQEHEQLKKKGIEVVVGDVTSADDVRKAYEGYDTVVSALGRPVILAQIQLLELAEASSTIHTFYPSEFGTDVEYGPQSAGEKPHQLKLAVRKHVREHVRRLHVTFLVTGPYADLCLGRVERFPPELGRFDVRAKKGYLLGTGKEKVSYTTMHDAGVLLAAALKTPTQDKERVLRVNSFTLSQDEILAEFEKQTGARWEVAYTSFDELRRMEKEAWEGGHTYPTPFTLRRIWAEGGTLYEKRDNEKIGDPPLDKFEDQVKTAIAKQLSGNGDA